MTTLLVLLITMIPILPVKNNDTIKTMTFNIRYGTANDGDNSWNHRKDMVFKVVRDSDCDFIGLQEAMVFQIEEILDNCPSYRYFGVTREVDPTEGEASPILYNASEWEMTEGQTLWLSETPEMPGSRSWNSSLPRVFTWGRFHHKENNSEILIINTHYDHISEEARLNSSRVIIDHIFSTTKGTGAILLGDFNAAEDQQPVTYLTTNPVQPLIDVYRSIHKVPDEKDMTFYGWQEHKTGTGKRLDYIFCTGGLVPLSSGVVDFNIGGRYPSDHMPVIAEFK